MRKGAKKLRLLIADDHELVCQGIRSTLQARRGWSVVGEAINGDEAVRKARDLPPYLAILEITMPQRDGLEAKRRILKVAPNTKVLILTMHESDQMVRRVLETGARGYVLKSDLATQLVKAVAQVCEGRVFL